MEHHLTETIENINKEFGVLKNPNQTHKSRLSNLDKLALFITNKIGTMGFFFIVFTWTVCWLSWNIFAPSSLRFDPYPAFVLWLFISNLIQLHLMPLLLIGQNIQGRHAEMRADYDFKTDRKAEKEIETILLHLEEQQKLILEVLRKIESKKD
jgi:uncharacterized membrane protein